MASGPCIEEGCQLCSICSEWDFNFMLLEVYFVVGTEKRIYFSCSCLQRMKVGEGKYKIFAIAENICG